MDHSVPTNANGMWAAVATQQAHEANSVACSVSVPVYFNANRSCGMLPSDGRASIQEVAELRCWVKKRDFKFSAEVALFALTGVKANADSSARDASSLHWRDLRRCRSRPQTNLPLQTIVHEYQVLFSLPEYVGNILIHPKPTQLTS